MTADPLTSAVDSLLPTPEPGRPAAEKFVDAHLPGLHTPGEFLASPRIRGGQVAADAALAAFDVTGYASRRNNAYPERERGASRLSPYIRHGLLSLPDVWDAVTDGPSTDVRRFHDELLWQEYARHWYARLGPATGAPLRRDYRNTATPTVDASAVWDQDMACLELTIGELEEDGWLVNQTRMWLASHWTVRNRLDWRVGEDYFFRHLLDGSRAANRLGWQWTSGLGSERAYGFSRWQVEKRAAGLCASCELGANCPIDEWPDDPEVSPVAANPLVAADPDVDARRGPSEPPGPMTPSGQAGPMGQVGPSEPSEPSVSTGSTDDVRLPEFVWLTAESLGDKDPALAANPDLPAVFVFDQPLLARLQLSSKRLVFLTETLAELATRRPVELHLGKPTEVLASRPLATTFAPVPGWRTRSAKLDVVELHPWPWLRQPIAGTVGSFSGWRKQLERV
ncbi:MAG: FAD-binding domain-containing protein [Actinomycetota bacterium]